MQNKPHPQAPASARRIGLAIPRRMKLPMIIAGGVAALFVLALIAVNVLISADWVRDRVAARIKDETGRELKVNGSTTLLFMPSPRIIITDATISDPEARTGTSDFSVAHLVIDLSLGELLSRQVDADRVVLERPVFTVRLGSDAKRRADLEETKPRRFIKATAGGEDSGREIRLKDVQIENGTVNLIYENGKVRRVEHIAASLSLPALTDPFTGKGSFDWKRQTVSFSFELTAPADLRDKRPARLLLALDTAAIMARFDGSVLTRPSFSGQGELSAKANSIPSLLAWMREGPAAEAAIGDGELASHVAWKEGEVTFSNARFALQHASGQGQAVVTFTGQRPHVRAALALDHLDLNPFLASTAQNAASAVRRTTSTRSSEATRSSERDWLTKPEETVAAEIEVTPPPPAVRAVPTDAAPTISATPQTEQALSPSVAHSDIAPSPPASAPVPVAAPAAFDADINLNVRKTRVSHLDIGPSSLGLTFRDGVLDATLGGMELYDGNANGKLLIDASRPVPSFSGNFRLDGVQARSLLSDAAQFSLISGRTKLELDIAGTGSTSEEIKSSLQGQASVVVSDGAIEGLNITEMINSVGAGQIPNLRQGPGARTTFSDLGGSFTIANGIAETSNLQMLSPVLKVKAVGTVNLVEDSLDILAQPEIVAGPEGRGGANNLAGLSVPVRIEGPLQGPTIRPEIKGMFSDPETAGRTVNQIGEAIQKKFKGRPVGEALGRFLGNVQIGSGRDDAEAPQPRPRSGQAQRQQGQPTPDADEQVERGEPEEPVDPDIEEILR